MRLNFTQYLRPNGIPRQVHVEVSNSFQNIISELIVAGARFEAEVLQNGNVSFTVEMIDDEGEEITLASELTENNEKVLEAVDRLIKTAHKNLLEHVQATESDEDDE